MAKVLLTLWGAEGAGGRRQFESHDRRDVREVVVYDGDTAERWDTCWIATVFVPHLLHYYIKDPDLLVTPL